MCVVDLSHIVVSDLNIPFHHLLSPVHERNEQSGKLTDRYVTDAGSDFTAVRAWPVHLL